MGFACKPIVAKIVHLTLNCSSVLLILTVLSFLPQLRHTINMNNSTVISLCYVVFNLVSATEQCILLAVLIFAMPEGRRPELIIHNPPNTLDYINVTQLIIFAIGWLVLYVARFVICVAG